MNLLAVFACRRCGRPPSACRCMLAIHRCPHDGTLLIREFDGCPCEGPVARWSRRVRLFADRLGHLVPIGGAR